MQLINAAYTSQIDHRTECFTGVRKGDRFYCANGEVYQADENAAKNVRARLYDPEIDRWTDYKKPGPSCSGALTVAGWDCSTRTPVAPENRYQRRANYLYE
ncbi:MAG: hypothetical protein GY874_18585 [Desulfobacteraceae bacterium]|nr:hypothetical protein [Desulfobacteraceae bacterium]